MQQTKFTRWILVAGIGRQEGIPESVCLVAQAVGTALAEAEYGLVVGGWPGVDYIVSDAFSNVINKKRRPLSDYLIQVVASERPGIYPASADYPDFKGGHQIQVPTGIREWIEALKYAEAVVLIGGEGGTFETYLYAIQEQRPVFPIASTGDDALKAYTDILEQWEVRPTEGIPKISFQQILSRPAHGKRECNLIATELISLINMRLAHTDNSSVTKDNMIFMSYAREDRIWLSKIRNALRPLERRTAMSVWDDSRISPGHEFEKEILSAIEHARVAVLLVSDDFLESEFIRSKELPLLLERNQTGKMILLWLRVGGSQYASTQLSGVHAVHNVEVPLEELSPAEQQDALVELRRLIAKELV